MRAIPFMFAFIFLGCAPGCSPKPASVTVGDVGQAVTKLAVDKNLGVACFVRQETTTTPKGPISTERSYGGCVPVASLGDLATGSWVESLDVSRFADEVILDDAHRLLCIKRGLDLTACMQQGELNPDGLARLRDRARR